METMPPILFNRARLRKRRLRALPDFAKHNFLYREAAERLVESMDFIQREFPTIVELGAGSQVLRPLLAQRRGTVHYIACDGLPTSLAPGLRVAADEEWLPFAENSVDAVVSVLSLHWVNDLPGTLAQVARMLKPDGLFMAVLPGGETLRELRESFATVESAQRGGISPRIAPFIDVRDAGALLQRAGFALPVADSETITVTYPHLFALMDDLRGTAQVNMLHGQSTHFTSCGFFADVAAHYAANYSDNVQQIKATMELVTLTGWKPAANQQQPARRGSGKVSLRDALQ